MEKMELGNNYQTLLRVSQKYIDNIRGQILHVHRYTELSPANKPYVLGFTVYHIRFEIRVEILTDCEVTKTGHLRFYWQDFRQEESPWVPFEILPRNVGEKNAMPFQIYQHGTALEVSGSTYYDNKKEFNSGNLDQFGLFIAELLEKSIADAKLPIPLHLVTV